MQRLLEGNQTSAPVAVGATGAALLLLALPVVVLLAA
jgi:hypothetical protein